MSFHPDRPLTFGQTQTQGNRIQRGAVEVGGPVPFVAGAPFSLQSGLAQMNAEEGEMLRRVVERLRRQRERTLGIPVRFGRAFGA